MSWSVPSWSDIKAGWSSGWQALYDQATRTYASAAQVDPTGTLTKVQAFVDALSDSRATPDRMAAKLPNPPVTDADKAAVAKHHALNKRYHELAAGFYDDAQPATDATVPSTGAVPVLVVGAVAVGAVGVAWALAAYEYAVNLREQTDLAERELDARIEASREGRALQPSTLPPPPRSESAAKGMGWLLVGGLAVAAGVIVLPTLLKK